MSCSWVNQGSTQTLYIATIDSFNLVPMAGLRLGLYFVGGAPVMNSFEAGIKHIIDVWHNSVTRVIKTAGCRLDEFEQLLAISGADASSIPRSIKHVSYQEGLERMERAKKLCSGIMDKSMAEVFQRGIRHRRYVKAGCRQPQYRWLCRSG